MSMLLLYIMYSLACIFGARLARASILSAHKIRSSLRINTSTKNTFDHTRRSGIRKVHAAYTYPRKVHSTYWDTTWILPRSARSCSRDFIFFYVSTLHVVFHIDRAERRKDNDNPDNTNYPSSREISRFSTHLYTRCILKYEHRS